MSTRKYLAGAILATEVGSVFSSNSSLAMPADVKIDKEAYEKILSFFSENKKLVWFIVSCLGIVTLVAIIIYFLNKSNTLALDSNKSKPLTFDYTGKEDLSFLKGKIKSGDTLKVTFKGPSADSLFCGHLEKLADELAPFFILYDSEDEVGKLSSYPEGDEIAVKLKCYNLCDFLSRKIAEYKSISTLKEYCEYIEFYRCIGALLLFVEKKDQKNNVVSRDRYAFERLVINNVLGGSLIDGSYTRNSYKEEEEIVESLFKGLQNFGDEKVIDVVLASAKARYLLKDAVVESIIKDGNRCLFKKSWDGRVSFDVSSDPSCIDLVKYMLVANDLVTNEIYDKGAYCVFLDKIILHTFSAPNITGGKLEQDKKLKKELFSYWLDLKNKKEPTEVAFKLVGFLKKFLKDDEIKTIKDKYLKDSKGKSDSRFLELFEENGKL